MNTATALAHPNIAFIKYWGKTDQTLNLPANGSISMNLAALETVTTVQFDPALPADTLEINTQPVGGAALTRVQRFMDQVRALAQTSLQASITSHSNFPSSAGIASSASAFAALALAASAALDLRLTEHELSVLARLGSGSAARSVPGGFVEWRPAAGHADSYAESIAAPEHWDLQDIVVIVQDQPKHTGSTGGHALADTSPLQCARVENAPARLAQCRQAILERDFTRFAGVVELDSLMMHAVMMTSRPPLYYWEPLTLQILKLVADWRAEGIEVCATVDAGANPHLLCTSGHAQAVLDRLKPLAGVKSTLISGCGGPARLVGS